tara:strand:- start:194655 stop:195305 length:651 start_codon:yes stop_codon:yes gene_type:complete
MQNIQDQQGEGLAVQLGYAYYNRNILLELRKIKDNLSNDTPDHLKELFGYMERTSRDNTILHIAKIYDRKSRNKTRRLIKLINQLISSDLSIKNKYFTDSQWPKFLDRHTNIFSHFEKPIPNCNQYLKWCLDRIEELENDSESSLNKVRTWRDKILAHNEAFDRSKMKMDDYEVDFLLEFAEAVLDFTNSFASTDMHVILRKSRTGFVKNIFEEYL